MQNNTKEGIVDNFFNLLSKNRIDEAIKEVFVELIKWMSEENILQVKQQLAGFTKYLGEFNEYEFLGTKLVSQKYTVDYYFAYYDRQPILFEFTFYKAQSGWRVQTFNFKTDYDDFIQGIAFSRIG